MVRRAASSPPLVRARAEPHSGARWAAARVLFIGLVGAIAAAALVLVVLAPLAALVLAAVILIAAASWRSPARRSRGVLLMPLAATWGAAAMVVLGIGSLAVQSFLSGGLGPSPNSRQGGESSAAPSIPSAIPGPTAGATPTPPVASSSPSPVPATGDTQTPPPAGAAGPPAAVPAAPAPAFVPTWPQVAPLAPLPRTSPQPLTLRAPASAAALPSALAPALAPVPAPAPAQAPVPAAAPAATPAGQATPPVAPAPAASPATAPRGKGPGQNCAGGVAPWAPPAFAGRPVCSAPPCDDRGASGHPPVPAPPECASR